MGIWTRLRPGIRRCRMVSTSRRMVDLIEGAVVWVELDPMRGREQGGRRPALVVSTQEYLDAVTTLAVVLPVTNRDRGWRNHIELTGRTVLPYPSLAMTEQSRSIAREWIARVVGLVDVSSL